MIEKPPSLPSVEQQLNHLRLLLTVLRELRRALERPNDVVTLIRECCDLLVGTRGYSSALLVLVDADGVPQDWASAGSEALEQLSGPLSQGRLPACFDEAAQQAGSLFVNERSRTCVECALRWTCPDDDVFCASLRAEGKTLGFLSVSVQLGYGGVQEEQDFFDDMVRDLALALGERQTRRQLQREYKASVESVSEAVVLCSLDGLVCSVNPAAQRISGRNEAELLSRPFREVFALYSGDEAYDPLEQLRLYGQLRPPASELVLCNAFGAQLDVSVSAVSPCDDEGSAVNHVLVIRDESDARAVLRALRASEQGYRQLFESVSAGIAELDLQFRILSSNPAFAKLLAVPSSELLRRSLYDFVAPESRPLLSAMKQSLANCADSPVRQELRLGHSEAPQRWALLELSALPAEPGPAHCILTMVDISSQKRAERELLLNDKRMQSLIDISQHPAQDIQALLDFALERALELTQSKLGYIYHYQEASRRFVLNTWSKEVMPACEVAEPLRVYELDKTGIWGEVVRQRRAIMLNDFRSPHPHKRGVPEGHVELERFLSIPVFDGEAIVAVVGVANKEDEYGDADVMQLSLLMASVWKVVARFEAERRLRDSERRARALYRHLPIPTFIWELRDGDFELVDYNDTAGELTRGGIQLCLGARLEDFYQDRPDIIADIRQAHQGLQRHSRELEYHYKSVDLTRILRVLYAPIPPDRVLVQTEDISEQRELQAQLQNSQKMEAVGRLAGGIAHDFNNMLAVIGSYVQFALDALRESDPLRDDLLEITKASARATALTRQLLAFSRKQIREVRVVDLNEITSELEKMLRRLLREDISLELRLATHLPKLEADPGQLEQLIVNLVVNARDAIEGTGAISLETRVQTLSDFEMSKFHGLTPGRYVHLSIRDTGRGMSEDLLSHIFEPFFTTKELGKGTGLGLATVYGIVKQHVGDVRVHSQLGIGTQFDVYLPCFADQFSERPVSGKLRLPDRGGSESILVVEDEAAVRRLSARILEAVGYRVLTAANGGEALLLCEGEDRGIDLLLTDVVMPQLSGRQLAERLQQVRPNLRVLFMSGYTDGALVQHGVLDSHLHFISKPFSAEELRAKVRSALDS